MESFGVKFGRLVRQKRGVEGLTQEALAIAAFDDPARKTRISEIENGKIDNPQAATVDALVVALGMSAEELTECRTPVAAPIPPEVERPDLPPLLLENLAMRFGIESPDAPAAELEAFLKDAAVKHCEMKERLAAMTAEDPRLENLLGAAQAAMDAGEFAEADARLADAEEIQQTEHTLKQVRKQAQMRKERGRAALLNFEVEEAYGHFAEAAAYFEPFDKEEAANETYYSGAALREHGLRFAGSAHLLAIETWKRTLSLWTKANNPEKWGWAQNALAVALQEQGIRAEGEAGQTLLAEAVTAYRAALEVRTRDAMPMDWAMTQNNLGIALKNQGIRAEGEAGQTLLAEAVTAYRAALEVRTRDAMPVDWAMTQNNLGIALAEQGKRQEGGAASRTLREAVTAYCAALEVYTRAAMPVQWATTQNNLGNALQEQGKRQEGGAASRTLREAVTAYRAALEVRTRDAMPVDWAMTQNNLGNALAQQGKRQEGGAASRTLQDAVTAFRAALEVRTRDAMPVDWAATQENMALAIEAMAESEPEQAEAHLLEALRHVDLALEVFDPEHMPFNHTKATRLREEIVGTLVGLAGE